MGTTSAEPSRGGFASPGTEPTTTTGISNNFTERIHSISEIHPEEIRAHRGTYCLPRIHRETKRNVLPATYPSGNEEERIACHVSRSHESIGKAPPKVGQADKKKH